MPLQLITLIVQDENGVAQTLVGGADAPAPAPINPADYDGNGWSLKMDFDCVVTNAYVNAYLARLAVGDEFEQAEAASVDSRFAVQVPGRTYSRDTILLIDRSRPETMQWVTGRFNGMRFFPFYPNSVPGPDSNQEGMVLGDAEPGVLTPVLGDAADDDYLDVSAVFIRRSEERVNAARRAAGRAAAGQIAPGRV